MWSQPDELSDPSFLIQWVHWFCPLRTIGSFSLLVDRKSINFIFLDAYSFRLVSLLYLTCSSSYCFIYLHTSYNSFMWQWLFLVSLFCVAYSVPLVHDLLLMLLLIIVVEWRSPAVATLADLLPLALQLRLAIFHFFHHIICFVVIRLVREILRARCIATGGVDAISCCSIIAFRLFIPIISRLRVRITGSLVVEDPTSDTKKCYAPPRLWAWLFLQCLGLRKYLLDWQCWGVM